MNSFRTTPDRSLDRLYLRTCAIYRLLRHGKINRAEALELQNRRYACRELSTGRAAPPAGYLTRTIEIWLAGPLSEKGRAERALWRGEAPSRRIVEG